VEIEVKVPVESLEAIRQKAKSLGYSLAAERHFESNLLYDFPGRALGTVGCLLRIRQTPRGGLLTFKGKVVQHESYKIRPEHETWCDDAGAARQILEAIGLRPFFKYEKYREEYRAGDAMLCLDELSFGNFLELEGSPQAIETLAEALGLDRSTFNKRSYADLYAEHCRKLGQPFGDITFKDRPDGNP
jgi:adenylate cyclase class 2